MELMGRTATMAALLMFAAACSSEPYVPTGPVWVALGQGESAYAAMDDDATVPIVFGPQGGYMIALALQAGGVVPGVPGDPTATDNPRMTYSAVLVETGETLGIITEQRGLQPAGNGQSGDPQFEAHGTWLIFNPAVDTTDYFDAEIRLELRLVDSDGRTATDQVTVTATAPPDAQ